MQQGNPPKFLRQAEVSETTDEFAALGVALVLDKRRDTMYLNASILASFFSWCAFQSTVVLLQNFFGFVQRPILVLSTSVFSGLMLSLSNPRTVKPFCFVVGVTKRACCLEPTSTYP